MVPALQLPPPSASHRSTLMLNKLIFAPIAALVSLSAHSGTVGLGGFSGSETVVNFSGVDIPLTTSAVSVGGLTMSGTGAGIVVGADIFGVWAETPQASGGNYLSNRDVVGTDITLEFAGGVNRVGMWINGGNRETSWTFSAFDGDGLLIGSEVFVFSLFDGYPDPSTFAGIEFSTTFETLRIVETNDNGQYTSIDDVRYERVTQNSVPEPGTLALLGVPLAGLIWAKRRRTQGGPDMSVAAAF